MSSNSNQIQKKLFGWDKFAEDIGGVYLIEEREVRFQYRGWECFLEWEEVNRYPFNRYQAAGATSMYACLVLKKEFTFVVRPISWWGKFKRSLRKATRVSKNDQLRRHIEALSDQPTMTDRFFLGTEMETRLIRFWRFQVSLQVLWDKAKENGKPQSKLLFRLEEDLQNRIRLNSMYEFFTTLLDRLIELEVIEAREYAS